MDEIQRLIELFREFPGIGPRQAKRFVYFLLAKNNGYTGELSRLIGAVRKDISVCDSCSRFFQKDASDSRSCTICRDNSRDQSLLMLVPRDTDFESIEKSGSYKGLYFILGGTVPILEKNPEKRIRQRELMEQIEKRASKGLAEVIIAVSYNPEGEHTLSYVTSLLRPVAEKYSITISTLGRGLSTGTELEYSDVDTIKNALKNRA